MIGKVTIGKSFAGCIKYCLNDKIQEPDIEPVMKNRAEIIMFNQCYGNEKELVQQFNDVRRLNAKLSKPVLHITLSLAPGEQLSKDKLMEMSQACAKEFGFENNQYVAIEHRDTLHRHIHIVANRVGYDKRTVSDSNSYKKVGDYCRKMEQRYNLQRVQSPRRFLAKEQRSTPRLDQRKERLKEEIRQALCKSNTFEQFERQMKTYGYTIKKGRGISFTDEKKVKVKGSELNYSLQTIERLLDRKQLHQSEQSRINSPVNSNLFQMQPIRQEPATAGRNNASKMLNQLLKPEGNQEQLDPHLVKKPRQKRRRSQHL
ncbi:relaxase [Segetibacter sp. 3557_3]|uniref:relaxase/mobilization nuclease domain-containing protein n=1 Tax=Segetibacter sp. 3557_3 TaxID=2547429 RepID=UPI00105913CE|nr:relaxase/mobilization nuclease domain-containing protein [Segetibacter sp. 3557_3]TDH23981.1 relaxase [Segetibacter sp. 3557_3]